MSIAGLLTQAVTITTRAPSGTFDEFGDETFTDTETDTVGELQQRQRDETSDPGQVSATSWLLVLPAGTTIGAGDKVTIDGDDFEVIGEPWPARNPRTSSESHVEATVSRVSGVTG